MAEGPREKPPRPRPSRPAPPRVATDNEATVFTQPKPKVASVVPAAEVRGVTGPSPAVSVSPSGSIAPAASLAPSPSPSGSAAGSAGSSPSPSGGGGAAPSGGASGAASGSSAPGPVVVHKPNPNAAPLESEHTMMMAPPPQRAPGGQSTLVSTAAMKSPLMSGEVRAVAPSSQAPPAYGPNPNMRPQQQWGQPPPSMQPNMQQPPLPRGMMGSAPGPIGTPPPMQPMRPGPGSVAPPPMGGMQQQPFRAAPPPPAPPGIVLQGNIDGRIILVKEPESARATSFRLLRDNLLARRLPRIIAVSSPMPADGKTTCAINLALALSEGARVLLLDGAIAEPELDQIFGITDQTVPSVVHGPWAAPYKIAELSPSMSIGGIVLPPGQPPPRFERRWFEQLTATLRRSHYDFILVDTAAFSTSPTVGQLVSLCDGTVLAVRAGITTARALRRATEQIPDGRAIGVALIDAKPGP